MGYRQGRSAASHGGGSKGDRNEATPARAEGLRADGTIAAPGKVAGSVAPAIAILVIVNATVWVFWRVTVFGILVTLMIW